MNKQELISSITDEEQRTFNKFSVLLGHDSGEIHRQLQHAIGHLRKWTYGFKEGRTDTKIAKRPGPGLSVRTPELMDQMEQLMEESRGWSMRELAFRLGVGKDTVRKILNKDMNMKKLLNQWVPHVLTENQKYQRWHDAYDNKCKCINPSWYLRRIIAIDESWVPSYTPLPRHRRRSWIRKGEPVEKVPKQELHERKVMLVAGMDYDGVAFWDVLEQGQTMAGPRYKAFLEQHVTQWQARKHIQHPLLLHDNCRPHKAIVVRKFLKEHRWSLLLHPPYSPDMNPLDYNCFGHLKQQLAGYRYDTLDSLQNAISEAISVLNEKGTLNGVQKLPDIWQRVIDSNGDYVIIYSLYLLLS